MYKVRAINFGWYHRKHGILLENLPEGKKNLLLENKYFKFLDPNPQLYEIIFKVEDDYNLIKTINKIYPNYYKGGFSTYKQILKDFLLLDWKCAICEADIKCKMNPVKNVENYVCEKCSESHNSTNKSIDQRIIDSSIKFINHCKKVLKKEQKEFIKYARESSKS